MGYIFENCHGDTVCNQQHGDIYIYMPFRNMSWNNARFGG